MDDKPSELASLQEKVLRTLETFSTLIVELTKQVQESNELRKTRLQQEMSHLNSVPLLGNQFRRRDGDGYGTIPRKFGTTEPLSADHKTGDL